MSFMEKLSSFCEMMLWTREITLVAIRGAFKQNQFGSTFGGPHRTEQDFLFHDYQGTRLTQGQVAEVPVPSSADLTGNWPTSQRDHWSRQRRTWAGTSLPS